MARTGPKEKRGGQGRQITPEPPHELTDEEMERELKDHFQRLNALIDKFMAQPPKHSKSLDDMMLEAGFEDPSFIYKDTLKTLIEDYIKPLNDDLAQRGDIFAFYDEDQTISILYKDGTQRYIGVGWWDSDKRIPTSNIDSIIIDGSWGTAIAGKNVRLYNYREEVDYGRYGYRNVKARYDDWDSIRADFK